MRRNPGRIRAKVRGVNRVAARLAQKLLFHRTVLRFGNQTPADAALVGDDEDAEAGFFQAAQRFGYAGEDLYPCGVPAVVGILHEGAVAIEEDRAALVS